MRQELLSNGRQSEILGNGSVSIPGRALWGIRITVTDERLIAHVASEHPFQSRELHILACFMIVAITITPASVSCDTLEDAVAWAMFDAWTSTGEMEDKIDMAIDSQDFIHIAFIVDYELKYATNKNGAWTVVTVCNRVHNCAIAMDSEDNVHLLFHTWYYSYPDSISWVVYATNRDGDWTFLSIAGPDAYSCSGCICIDSQNAIHLAYVSDRTLTYAKSSNDVWETATLSYVSNYDSLASLSIDSDCNAHIAYYDGSSVSLGYASNSEGIWNTYTLDNMERYERPSAFVDAADRIHICYEGESSELRYAVLDGNQWALSTIGDLAEGYANPSVVVDSVGASHICYRDYTLKYATNAGGTWSTFDVDDTPGDENALALMSNDTIHLTYVVDQSVLRYCTNAITPWTPSPPINAIATSLIRAVGLDWDEPLSDGLNDIQKFEVFRTSQEESLHLVGEVDGHTFHFEDDTVQTGVLYSYRISAINAVGASEYSDQASGFALGVSPPPIDLVSRANDTAVNLSWNRPSVCMDFPISTYFVYRSLEPYSWYQDEIDYLYSTNATTYEDRNVLNGLEYNYWVTAGNDWGESVPSNAVLGLPKGPPSAPTEFEVTGFGSLTLHWSSPWLTGGSEVSSYNVYRGDRADELHLIAKTGNTTYEFRDDSASEGKRWYYAVSAQNEVGEGTLTSTASIFYIGVAYSTVIVIASTLVAAASFALTRSKFRKRMRAESLAALVSTYDSMRELRVAHRSDLSIEYRKAMTLHKEGKYRAASRLANGTIKKANRRLELVNKAQGNILYIEGLIAKARDIGLDVEAEESTLAEMLSFFEEVSRDEE